LCADAAATRRFFLPAAVCLFLAACALPPRTAPEPSPGFTLNARVVVKGRDSAFASGLRWVASEREDELWLNTPLGQTLAYLKRDGGGATATTADQTQYRAGSLESLMRSALGWELPVAGLRYWVLGRAASTPAPTEAARDARGRLTVLVQDGWRVSFEYDGEALQPLRVQGTRAGAEFRLAVDTLDLAPEGK
jgi:outer membrane lipoprotein LolB